MPIPFILTVIGAGIMAIGLDQKSPRVAIVVLFIGLAILLVGVAIFGATLH